MCRIYFTAALFVLETFPLSVGLPLEHHYALSDGKHNNNQPTDEGCLFGKTACMLSLPNTKQDALWANKIERKLSFMTTAGPAARLLYQGYYRKETYTKREHTRIVWR